MQQARGVLPQGEDRAVLYRNPRMCGYFVWVRLSSDLGRAELEGWFRALTPFVDELVARDEQGHKMAAVAMGLGPTFFTRGGTPRWDPPIEPPAAFRPDPAAPLPNTVAAPLTNAAVVDADILFYVAATLESRVSRFVERLSSTAPTIDAVLLDRGYQRDDEREPFGYRDGLRNVVPTSHRPEVVFVHRDEHHPEEPAWADKGTYLAYIKILQQRDAFTRLDTTTQDQVIGRNRDGDRLDLIGQHVAPRHEPPEIGSALPDSAHVRKAGPRGTHDDCEIFRRGLPFLETSSDGRLRVGLQFCSFQASLDQFDVIFNDWMTNARFPNDASGFDALLDPARGLTVFEKTGFYFVPPQHESGVLAASLFDPPHATGRTRTARLVIRKRIVDASDPTRRFERRGFVFTILDATGTQVDQVTTDTTGRAIVHGVRIGETYTVREETPPLAGATQLAPQAVTIDRSHQELRLVDQMPPNSPYR